MLPHFRIPLNLPHAGTIALRIDTLLTKRIDPGEERPQNLLQISGRLIDLLWSYRTTGENPPQAKAETARQEAAALGRQLVDEIEALGMGGDRIGQCIRNLFECLEMGEEGAEISLRAGENPNSLQRPT